MTATTTDFITRTAIPGLFLIERPVFPDERGFFHEVERRAELEAVAHRPIRHVQWNHSRSRKGTLRGIHVARWNKCGYVMRGTAQVVVVDLRLDSPTFGRHESVVIGERRRASIVVPAGCGNSFLVLSSWVDFAYSVDEEWAPGAEYGVAWNDPDLAIRWKARRPILSDKDQHNPTVRELFPDRFPVR